MKKFLSLLASLILALSICLPIAACKDKEPEVKDKYTVTFDYNYDDAPAARTREVKADTRVVALPDPSRTGYEFIAWCTDKEGKAEYNFSEKVNKDFTLYASWVIETPKHSVTFDFNYANCGNAVVVDVEQGKTISASSIPECPRLGYVYNGWYKDEAKTQVWNMDTDKVSGSITLYADYEYDPSVERDSDGNIVYDNVEIDVNYLWDWGNQTYVNSLINKFNYQYKGKIKVNMPTTDENESIVLRERQSQGIVPTRADYYPAQDVYDLAGIEFNADEYYSEAIKDCYIDGKLYTTPVMMSIPYFVYNTALMDKYNVDESGAKKPLPSTFDEFKALLLKVYEGEYNEETNSGFVTAKTNIDDWTFKEMTSSVSFLQNGSVYYKKVDGKLVNDWTEDLENNKAINALNNMNDIFGANGACHGARNGDFVQVGTIADVAAGRAFCGLLHSAMYNGTVPDTQGIGILPLSGLFTNETEEYRNLIPAHNIGYVFYKAPGASLTEVAACGVFADFISKNCSNFVSSMWYPANKDAAQTGLNPDANANATAKKTAAVLKQIGNPENFYSIEGSSVIRIISNEEAATKYIVPMLKNTAWDIEYDAAASVLALRDRIRNLLGQ